MLLPSKKIIAPSFVPANTDRTFSDIVAARPATAETIAIAATAAAANAKTVTSAASAATDSSALTAASVASVAATVRSAAETGTRNKTSASPQANTAKTASNDLPVSARTRAASIGRLRSGSLKKAKKKQNGDLPEVEAVRALMVTAAKAAADLERFSAEADCDPRMKSMASVMLCLFSIMEVVVDKTIIPLVDEQANLVQKVTEMANIQKPVIIVENTTAAKRNTNQCDQTLRNELREADKTSVIFAANLGHMPTANRETLANALIGGIRAAATATAERAGGNSAAALGAVDDALSCVVRTEFLGTRSSLYTNKQNNADSRNNRYYSMPIRVSFRDRGSRINFEQTLRTLCHMQVSISLPNRVRKLRNDFADELRAKYPCDIITVRPNIDENIFFALRKKDGDQQWCPCSETKTIE
jgi:hypothetical protein